MMNKTRAYFRNLREAADPDEFRTLLDAAVEYRFANIAAEEARNRRDALRAAYSALGKYDQDIAIKLKGRLPSARADEERLMRVLKQAYDDYTKLDYAANDQDGKRAWGQALPIAQRMWQQQR